MLKIVFYVVHADLVKDQTGPALKKQLCIEKIRFLGKTCPHTGMDELNTGLALRKGYTGMAEFNTGPTLLFFTGFSILCHFGFVPHV